MTLSTWIPSKDTTERIIPWLTFVGGVIGAIWVLIQYGNQVQSSKVENSLKYLKDYQDASKEESLQDIQRILMEQARQARTAVGDCNPCETENERRAYRDKVGETFRAVEKN